MLQKIHRETIIAILNNIAIFLYTYCTFSSLLDMAQYVKGWPDWYWKIREYSLYYFLVLAIIKLIFYYGKEKRVSGIACCVLCGTILLYVMGECDYRYIVYPMIAFYHADFRRIARYYVAVMGTILAVTYVCTKIGVVPDYYISIPGRAQKVHTLGFGGHNAFMAYWLLIVLALLFLLEKSKYRTLISIILVVGTWYFHALTDSETPTLLIYFAIGVLLVDGIIMKTGKDFLRILGGNWISRFMIGMPIYGALITIGGIFFYNKFQRSIIDNTFISRYYLACRALEETGARLPYATIKAADHLADIQFHLWNGTGVSNYSLGDILYANLLIRDGLMVLIPYVALQVWLLYRAYKSRNYMLGFLIAVVAVLNAAESVTLDIAFSIFSMAVFANWSDGRINETTEEYTSSASE